MAFNGRARSELKYMATNVFVLGLDENNRSILERTPGLEDCRFHALLHHDEIRGVEQFPVRELLQSCESRLRMHSGSIDAIVTLLDFPATELVPILTRRLGVPGPAFEAVLRCNHKYWSRLIQREAAPEHIPEFAAFDPFDPDVADTIPLEYPIWIKPLNSYRSHLGFRVGNRGDLEAACAQLREHLPRLSEPLQELLEHAELPERIRQLPEHACIAERIIAGRQCTLEGFVHRGETVIYGVVDSIREANRSTFSRYQYPSSLPRNVQRRMSQIAVDIVNRIGLDDSPFNIEMYYSARTDRIRVLEINPRISQSHAELFERVDGVSNERIMIDVALGRRPRIVHREGKYACAAKFFVHAYRDATVRANPDADEIAEAERRLPGTSVRLRVHEGMQLSQLIDEDSYSYELGEIYIGARNQRELLAKHRECEKLLRFDLARPPRKRPRRNRPTDSVEDYPPAASEGQW